MDATINCTVELARNPFTCLTCGIMFKVAEVRNKHYKSEWHRYNLQRKVANLPSETLDEFEKRTAMPNKEAEDKTNQNKNCTICRKKFNSEKQYKNHLASKKHKQNIKDLNAEDQVTVIHTETKMDLSGESDVTDSNLSLENPIDRNDCLFCEHHSRSITRNLKHMMVEHSFFVPDFEYCIDKRGLLTHLGEKIYGMYMCIWCNDSGKRTSLHSIRLQQKSPRFETNLNTFLCRKAIAKCRSSKGAHDRQGSLQDAV